jgi:hypothetical protein
LLDQVGTHLQTLAKIRNHSLNSFEFLALAESVPPLASDLPF